MPFQGYANSKIWQIRGVIDQDENQTSTAAQVSPVQEQAASQGDLHLLWRPRTSMINKLFGKFLLSCDYPDTCRNYIHLRRPEDADRALKENRWLAFVVGPNYELKEAGPTEKKLVFLCPPCQGKSKFLTPSQWRQLKEKAYTTQQ